MHKLEYTLNENNTTNSQNTVPENYISIEKKYQEALDRISLLEEENAHLQRCLADQQENSERSENSQDELLEDTAILLDVIHLIHHKIVLFCNRVENILDILSQPGFEQKHLDKALVSLDQLSKQLTDLREELGFGRERGRQKKTGTSPGPKQTATALDNLAEPIMESLEQVKELASAFEQPDFDCTKARQEVNSLLDSIQKGAEGNLKLYKQNKKLKAQAGQNDSNSHLSSGSIPRFKRSKRTRAKSELKPGGQKNHPGSTAVIADPDIADRVIDLYPPGIEADTPGVRFENGETRYLVQEINVTFVTAYQQKIAVTEEQGKEVTHKGVFPPDIKARVQYGQNFQCDATALDILGVMSKKRVSQYLDDRYGVSLSPATVTSMVARSARAVYPIEPRLRRALQEEPVVHFDETPVSLKGKDVYVHTASSSKYDLLKRGRSRGIKGAEDLGVAKGAKGVAVSDRFSLYTGRYFNNLTQAFCGAHLLRDLNKALTVEPGQRWAAEMKILLKEMNETARLCREEHKKQVPLVQREAYLDRYFAILREGCRENAGEDPARDPYPLTLLRAFEKYWPECTRFLTDLRVPFTNNTAEQALRMLKVKEKVSGTFRSEKGLDDYLMLRSYLQTAQKQGLNPLEALEQAVRGNPDYIFTHQPLEKALRKPPLRVVTKPKESGESIEGQKNSPRYKNKSDSPPDDEDNPDPDKTG